MDIHSLLRAAGDGLTYVLNNSSTIGAYVMGSAPLALIVHKVEASRGYKDLQKYGLFLLGVLALAAVLAEYVVSAHTQNPNVIPKNFAYLLTAAIFLRKFAVSPLGERLIAVRASKISPFFATISTIYNSKKPVNTTNNEVPAQPETPVQPPKQFSL